ncbi:AraC family transcriptional regulator [Rhodococcus chondri]|uniref:AraC family transcriptional regulator n=1 Tax=Rhodococcus chondri TaxID=3065941 RepID=A0ABU7JR04_9NOCA|nr:AraC family transcriptional regulator [Rhodococcus sp. CC-R104]MEE2032245.1 AraC family transcriptional regulator [Rhodococcus sp. CC-R104]
MKRLARYAAITGYAELCASLGTDPTPLLRGVGLEPAGLGLPDRWVPAIAIARLLERSAAATRCPDFGLRLVERRRFASLGPVSLVIREEPDVRSALKFLMRYQHMYNEALRMRLVEAEDVATIRVALELGEPADTRQTAELAMGVLHGLLRDFRGGRWQPLAVCFTHIAPEDISTHLETFGPMVKFDQEFTGIVLYTSDLDAPNVMSGPSIGPYARQFLDTLDARSEATPVTRVRELIELLLPTGRCSVEQVARSLGVDRRTVHRHLAGAGQNYTTVLNAVRVDLAEHLVAGRRYSLTEVSELLGFSSASNFSRWFSSEFGCSPRQWRVTYRTDPIVGAGDALV